MGVETSFARNLGGLMAPAAATSGPGPVGEARRSQARPHGMRVTSNGVLMLWFAPSSKPVTLTLSRARCQIRSELIQMIVLQQGDYPAVETFADRALERGGSEASVIANAAMVLIPRSADNDP